MRSTLSPAFTSSKMRLMVPFMVEVGEKMMESLRVKLKNSKSKLYQLKKADIFFYKQNATNYYTL